MRQRQGFRLEFPDFAYFEEGPITFVWQRWGTECTTMAYPTSRTTSCGISCATLTMLRRLDNVMHTDD